MMETGRMPQLCFSTLDHTRYSDSNLVLDQSKTLLDCTVDNNNVDDMSWKLPSANNGIL